MLEVEDRGTTRLIYFNYPPANGLNLEIVAELTEAIERLAAEADGIRCLILTSRLQGIFVAGADIKMIKRYMEGPNLVDDMLHFNTQLQQMINQIEALPFPVIAAINGHAMGGGLEMALACDFRFMEHNSARVGLPEVTLGLLPGAGGTQRLSRLIGKARAKEIIYNSLLLDAKEALHLGVVDRICPAGSLMEECLGYADQFSERASIAVSVVATSIKKKSDMAMEEGLRKEMDGLKRLLGTSDAIEGVTAFVEKRQPRFLGK